MANLDAPMGFVPLRNEYGTAPKIEPFTVTDAIEIFQGEVVCITGTGLIVKYTDALALDGKIIGVAAHYVSSTATDRELLVYTDVNQEYELQADDASITGVGDSIGRLFDITNPTTGSSTTRRSNAELDASSGASAAGNDAATLRPLLLLGESKQLNNEKNVIYSRYRVKFIGPVMARGMAAVGLGGASPQFDGT